MRHWRLIGLLVLLAPLAHAVMGPTRTLEGWTADGKWFVWSEGFDESRDKWVLVPARGGKETTLTSTEAWDAWLKQHPLAEEKQTGPTSADGKAEIVVKSKKGSFTDGAWGAQETRGESVTCSIKRGAGALPSTTFTLPRGGGSTRAGASLQVVWSPEGRRVAFFFESSTSSPTGTGDFNLDERQEVAIDRTSGPRIQLVGKDVPQPAFDGAAAALEKAGFAPTGQDTAQVTREKSVVFAAKGYEADAKTIAAAVPGGATVEALTWKPKFDVVVALGTSAQSP